LAWFSYRRGCLPLGFQADGEFDWSFTLRRQLLGAIGLLLLTAGCAEHSSTQIVVLMDTDYAVPGEVDRIRARVSKMVPTEGGSAEVETWAHVFSVSDGANNQPDTHDLPATFSVLPGGAASDLEVVIELDALAAGDGRVLVSRRVRTAFVTGEALLIRMLLYRACSEQICAAGESCGCAGATACTVPSCVDEAVSPDLLERIDNPGLLPSDAGIPVADAGMPDADLPGDGGTDPDSGVPDGGVINCEPPLLLCGMDCVNPQADPRYCGDCDTRCPSGFVCQTGMCMDPGDCRSNGVGCSGFAYCDDSTGECLPGCAEASQCTGEHEICDTPIHECVCGRDFERCEGLCVDTRIDPRYCGDCTRSCPPGDVCEAGVCDDPGDCRTNGMGCSGFTYCDQATGECLLGCEDDEQCVEDNEVCDTGTHDCVCANGFHRCGPVCASNDDVATCGDSCVPCPAPPNSTPMCEQQSCDFVCANDYERCDQMCCPTRCPPGQVLYDAACAKVHVQIADEAGNIGTFSAIALDAEASVYIAYYASSGKDLSVAAQKPDATWVRERPDGTDDVGMHASIAFDANGTLHVAYYNNSSKDLMLASKLASVGWRVEVIDDEGDVGEYASLAFDAVGNAHVGYYDSDNKDLMYATRQAGGAWAVQVVDENGDAGQFASLALDQSGRAHISYYDAGQKDLKHASRAMDGSWRTQVVASVGDVGKYTSLAFDPSGVAHISYYGESSKDLLYATVDDAGTWTSEPVESVGDVGTHSSLAFDDVGRARISYYDETSGDLKYALEVPGGWSIEVVDLGGDVGKYSSIAVDALGHAHIGYYDATNTNLKYALIAAPVP
jgi:hypothetical protein